MRGWEEEHHPDRCSVRQNATGTVRRGQRDPLQPAHLSVVWLLCPAQPRTWNTCIIKFTHPFTQVYNAEREADGI